MGRRKERADFEERDEEAGTTDGRDLVELIKRLQYQMTHLERKIDHLTALSEQKQERDQPYHAKPFEKGRRPHHGHGDRKFSHGRSRDDDRPAGGKPFGKPAGDSGKPFYAKMAGKFRANKSRRDA